LKGIVVEVDVVGHQLAGDVFPVHTGITRVGNRLVERIATNRPTSFGHPDWLALSSIDGLMVGVEEELTGSADIVGHGSLEIWVGVHAEKVEAGDEVIVSSIDVHGPCVDVANGLAVERSTADGVASLLNVVDQFLGLSAGTGHVLDARGSYAWTKSVYVSHAVRTRKSLTIQVFAADRDTLDKIGESGAVLRDSSFEGRDLVVDVCLAR